MTEWHTLYRAFDEDGTLLYIGISNQPLVRLSQHSKVAAWAPYVTLVTFERHPSRVAVEEAEVEAIHREQPVFNVRDSPTGSTSVEYLRLRRDRGRFVQEVPQRPLPPTWRNTRTRRIDKPPVVRDKETRSLFTPETLAEHWGCTSEQAIEVALQLVPRVTSYKIFNRKSGLRWEPEEIDLVTPDEVAALMKPQEATA